MGQWGQMGQRGPVGEQGPQGLPGPHGVPGYLVGFVLVFYLLVGDRADPIMCDFMQGKDGPSGPPGLPGDKGIKVDQFLQV